MADYVLQLKNINKYFGKSHVIKNVNLSFERGHFITFLGPSGCGKTTLLRMIAGFYEPDEGEILLNGKNVERIPPYGRNTSMVFQEYALFPHMNVFDNVSYGLKVKKVPKDEMIKRVEDALELMQLKGMEKRFPNQMSGGQQQRVAVARALVMKPDVLLLDEPLSNLDAKLRESVRVELRTIQQKMGLSVIYVTHDQSEALSMSDAVVVLKDGEAHQVGTPQEIYFEPKTQFVADFIGTTNLISVEGKGNNDVAYGNTVFHSTNPVTPGARYIVNLMFLGEKVRYFVKDELDKEWIVDMFDPGKTLLSGDAYVTFKAEKAWVIEDK